MIATSASIALVPVMQALTVVVIQPLPAPMANANTATQIVVVYQGTETPIILEQVFGGCIGVFHLSVVYRQQLFSLSS